MSHCADIAKVPVTFSQHYQLPWGTTWRYITWILPHTNGWVNGCHQTSIHPSIPGDKYEKALLEQEKKTWGQKDGSPMGANKKQKPNWNLEESLNLAKKNGTKALQRPRTTPIHIHPWRWQSSSLSTVLSIVLTSSCLPWCDVGMTCTRMSENDLALEKATYNCPWVNTGSSRSMPTFSKVWPWALFMVCVGHTLAIHHFVFR